jgi:hypothetical protein
MSYQTLEVELENGRLAPRGGETLPLKARGLLTILEADSTVSAGPTPSLGRLMQDVAGTGRGQFTDLSTNKQHLADFGR